MTAVSRGPSQRVAHYSFGDPQSVLRVEDGPRSRALGPAEVRVRISRSIIHPGDLQLIAAKYSPERTKIPEGRVPGSEAVGIVEDAAPAVLAGTGIEIGTRVAFLAQGAWQSAIDLPASSLVAIPDDISDEVATQILVNTVTARHVLRTGLSKLGFRPSHIVLTAAASAVGKLITVEALREGLHPIRLVRSAQSAARLADILPGGDIIHTANPAWQDAVRHAANADIPLVIDGVGGPMVGETGQLLNTQGLMVSFGLLDGGPSDLTMFLPKGLSLQGATIGTWRADTAPDEQAKDIAAAIEVARAQPRIFAGFQAFDLSDLKAAVEATTMPGKTGNVILNF